MAFWVVYDHVGKLVLANLAWTATAAPPLLVFFAALLSGDRAITLFLGLPALVLTLGVIAPVNAAAIAHLAKVMIDTGDASFADWGRGVKLYWRRAIATGFACLAAVAALLMSAWFYAVRLGAAAPWLGYAISALAVWCLALAALALPLAFPALVQKKSGVLATLKLAALLVLDNPLFCLGLWVYFVLLAALSIIILPFAAFFSGAAGVVLGSTAYEMLARKYAAVEREKQGAQTEPDGREGAVVSRGGKLVFDDSKEDYLNRGFRDFWFPWKA